MPPANYKNESTKYCKTWKELGIACGVNSNYLQQQAGENGFPIKTKKGYDIPATVQWLLAKKKTNGGTANLDSTLVSAKKEKLLDIKIKTAELDYQNSMLEHHKILQKLMPIAEVMQTLQSYGSVLNNSIESLISEIAVLTKNPKITNSAEEIKEKIQTKLANDLEKLLEIEIEAEKKSAEVAKGFKKEIVKDHMEAQLTKELNTLNQQLPNA